MKVIPSILEWQKLRVQLSGRIGFVPTMGNLHAGHLALYQQSIKENELTVASIFINPTQFNNTEDFKHYPKTIEEDLGLLEKTGVDYCLLPTKEMLYPDDYAYRLTEKALSLSMEGKHRPGHFDGVLTIVLKLFNLVQPTNAYFGKKDFQQYQLVKEMASALFLGVAVVGCPIVRDEFGLALSSRNNRLSKNDLAKARDFAMIFADLSLSIETLTRKISQLGVSIEYIEEKKGRRYIALFIGNIRLIDNRLL